MQKIDRECNNGQLSAWIDRDWSFIRWVLARLNDPVMRVV